MGGMRSFKFKPRQNYESCNRSGASEQRRVRAIFFLFLTKRSALSEIDKLAASVVERPKPRAEACWPRPNRPARAGPFKRRQNCRRISRLTREVQQRLVQ
jgi:hypothetical protein